MNILNSNAKLELLYDSETWRLTTTTISKAQTFTNKCLRKIINNHCPNTISNKQLWRRTKQITAEEEIGTKRWR